MNKRLLRAAAFLAIAVCSWTNLQQASAQILPPLPGAKLIVTLNSPSSGSTVSGTIPVSASVSIVGSLAVAGVRFRVDGVNIGGEDTSAPYSVSWDTRTVGNGSHTLTAVARDILGAQWTSNSVTVTVSNDITPPTVSITSPANGATVSGTITVTANASDNVGVAGVRFRLDGANLGAEDTSAPYSVSWNTTGVAAGTHTLTAVARDAAGNTRTSAPITVTVNDSTLPTVSITSPANGATVSGTITVTASASDTVGVVGVKFFLDGVLAADDTSAPYSVPWNTTGVANGSHTLTAVARDAAGNTRTSAAVTVTVSNAPPADTTPPTVSVTSPANGATVSGTITVTANASDNVGVAGVQFFLDSLDNPLGAEDTSAPYQVSWNTTTVSDGQHVIAAVARDAAGNRTTSSTVTVTVSNGGGGGTTRFEESSPAVSASPAGAWVVRGAEVAAFSGGVAGSSDTAGATVTFTFTGTAVSWIGLRCNICGIANVSIDGAAPTVVDTAGPAAPGSPGLASASVFAVSGLAAGSHTLVITVTGNTSSTGAHVIVDAFDVTGTGAASATRIEDTDPAVSYAGTWVRLNDPRGTNGTGSESRTAGDRATLSFTGTGVRWISFGNTNNGIARVFLDGALVGEVDTFRPAEQSQIEVFSAAGLTRGPHTLVIEVTGTANPSSTDVWVLIDAFDVTP
jgi:Big-like domain-containing protein